MQFFQAHATQFVALHAPAKFALWPIVFFSVQRNKIWSKNVDVKFSDEENKTLIDFYKQLLRYGIQAIHITKTRDP